MQQLAREGFGWCCEVKALSRDAVVGADESEEAVIGECGEIGLAGNEAAQATDGVLDAALLPGRVGVTEEGRHGELMEAAVTGELCTVVEGDRLAKGRRQVGEDGDQLLGDKIRGLVGRPGCEDDSGVAFMNGEDSLAILGEEHEIGFPVAGIVAIAGCRRSFGNWNAAVDEACRAAAASATQAALGLGAGEIEAPAIVLGASELSVDEAIDTLMADHRLPGLDRQTAGDLLGRPAASETVENRSAQLGLAFEAGARPAPGSRLFLGIARPVANLTTTVALQFARNGRWRAIHSCRDLPDRAPVGLKPGNGAPVFQ